MGEIIWDKRNLNFIPERPPLDASDEAFEAYRQASKEFHRRPRHTYSAEELDAGYVKYQELYRGQQDFKRAGYGNKELVEAMARLPNLHYFVMTMANCIEIASRYLGNFFAAGLRGPFGDTRNSHVDGVPQLQSIYRSAFLSGTKFKSFVCGDVGWQLFKSTKKDLAVLASVISESPRFSLQLSTGHDEQTDMLGSELRQCRRYLKNGRIRDLITQAEKLQSLRFILDWSDPVFGVDLKNVVGDHTWTRLSDISYGNMEGSEEDLVAFVERHALSLRRLHFETFSLISGQWTTALPRIRSSFKNTPDVLIERDLLSQSPLRHFYLGEALWDSRRVPEEKTHIERRESLQEWFKNGGDCPLVEEWFPV